MGKAVYWVILVVLICASSLSAATYYVDDCNGNDNWDGKSPLYVSQNTGPVKTISKGLQCSDRGDIIIVADGVYRGGKNLQLHFDNEEVTLKSTNGPDGCVLNFYGDNYFWNFNSDVKTLINGFTIKGITNEIIKVYQQNKLEFDNCIFENNTLEYVNSLITCYEQGSLKLNNCIFRNNIVEQGSIVKSSGFANIEVLGCELTENISLYDYSIISCMGDCNTVIANTQVDENWNYGGSKIRGIYCSGSANVKIIGCDITNNSSDYYASGIVCEDTANVIISGCNISNNSSMKDNYGICVRNGYTTKIKIENCIISDNSFSAQGYNEGCGIFAEEGILEVVNCLISGHPECGILIGSKVEKAMIKNCTIIDNIDACDSFGIRSYNKHTIFENCILKDNGNNQLYGKYIVVSYSDISDNTDHIWPGFGNLNADPLFADPNNGDYHLLSQAGRWDPDSQQWVRDDVSSPCIDGGDPTDWVGDEPAGSGGRINMGYFGGTAQASKTDFCNGSLPGDINRDCVVNFVDFALMTSNWLSSTIEQP